MIKWQPIETAPKDRRQLLLYGICEGEVNGMRDEPDVVVGSRPRDDGPFYVDEGDCYSVEVHATHWMLLPDPPND